MNLPLALSTAASPPSVTELLHRAAGFPSTTDKNRTCDEVANHCSCWWCGRPTNGRARHKKTTLPATFPFPLQASAPESEHLCMPCGWTLCDRVSLPHSIAVDRIRSKAEQGRRQQVSVRGGEPERWLALELADGTVGLWTCGPNAGAEKPWIDARKELREEPRDVGPCAFVEAVPYSELDAGPVEKFRSFHHLATADRWWPCTDSDRMAIREWLLHPPPAPWVAIIGDGKKHHAIAAQLLGAITTTDDVACVYYLGSAVYYRPAHLAGLIGAVEELVRAGASDDEIRAGSYAPRDLALSLATRAHEPTVAIVRGAPILDLALYLRRNQKELST